MPVVTVNGMPDTINRTLLVGLIGSIQAAVASVPELGLNADQVTVFFLSNLVQDGSGDELIAFVDGYVEHPKRPPETKNRLAQAVVNTLRRFAKNNLPQCGKIEVFVRSHRPDDGFAVWDPDLEQF